MAITDLQDSAQLFEQYVAIIGEQAGLISEINTRNDKINNLILNLQQNPQFQKNTTPEEQVYFTNLITKVPLASQSIASILAPTVQIAQPDQPIQP